MSNLNVDNKKKVKENIPAGIVGAFLFSLVGGILWYVLYQVGFVAGISGLVGAVCAIRGYSFFAKKESKFGVIIAVVIAAIVMVIAWYLCLSTDVYNAYQLWYEEGEVDYTLNYFESVRNAYLFLEDAEIAGAYLRDLGIGLLLCVVGAYKDVIAAFKKADEEEVAVEQEAVEVQDAVQEEVAPTQEEDNIAE